jgi:hypothetical protein
VENVAQNPDMTHLSLLTAVATDRKIKGGEVVKFLYPCQTKSELEL